MATIEQRLSALEQQAETNEHAIFFEVHPDDAEVPVLGWFFYHAGVRVDILRLPDEADGALRARAADACRVAGCPMILFETDPDRVNHHGFILPVILTPETWEAAAVKQQAAFKP